MYSISVFFCISACTGPSLKSAMQAAGDNRPEIEAFLSYSRQTGDTQKRRAAEFLVRNMPGHVCMTGRWQPYRDSLAAIFGAGLPQEEMIARANKYMRGRQPGFAQDIRTLTSEYLINNLEQSFEIWRTSPFLQHLSFDEFCETVLPYKCFEGQPADYWRDSLRRIGKDVLAQVVQVDEWRNGVRAAVENLNAAAGIDMGKAPLPLKGLMPARLCDWAGIRALPYMSCLEMSQLGVLLGRANGLPVNMEFLPNWPLQSQRHYWNTALAENGRTYDYVPFENKPEAPRHIDKRRAKVYRKTYSADPTLRRALQDGIKLVPPMSDIFVKDVSDHYNFVSDIAVPVKPRHGYAWLAVFDNEKWVPVQIGHVRRSRAHFPKVGCEVLYIVLSAGKDGIGEAVSDPFILDIHGAVRLIRPEQPGEVQDITLERKFPAFPHIWPFRDSLSHFVLEASASPDFRPAVEAARWEDRSLFSADRTVALEEPYRYWRLRGLREGPTTLAELYFFAGDSLVEPTRVSGIKIERLFDRNELTSMRIREDRSAVADFGRPVKLDRAAVLRRGDGNGIKPGDTYQLYWWDGSDWVLHEQKAAVDIRISFRDVPAGRLYRIRDISSGAQHRTFLYENGRCIWY